MQYPDILQSKVSLAQKNLSDIEHPLKVHVEKLLVTSDFACKQISILKILLSEDACQKILPRETYFSALNQLPFPTSQTHYMSQLRKFRNKHFLRLMLLETASLASTEAIMQSWSDCADALILHVLNYCYEALKLTYGIPKTSQGEPIQLHTLAMGKLGGCELNFSSDIDLIFTFSDIGYTDGIESLSSIQFFSKLIQQFIHIMQTISCDGFVFRVDLRLRPNGDSGALVTSLSGMETYYQEQGRDWERYAMVKARLISPIITEPSCWFKRLITPFIYRRYVDFSVIESLRSMKSLIEREVQLNPRLNDIKRGQGGIREIEFIIQNFQLIRGGRLPQLQQTNALSALQAIKKEGLLPQSEILKKAYLFLRQLENALQSLSDQQTHSLPQDETQQAQICLTMGFSQWKDLMFTLKTHQNNVSQCFQNILSKVEDFEDEDRVLSRQLTNLWQGHIEQDMAINLLTSLGFKNAARCYQMIHTFRHSPRCRRLSQGARLRLDRFMALLLTKLMLCPNTDNLLLQMLHMLETLVGRSAYLALLTENPNSLNELLFWLGTSSFVTSLLVQHPFLLETLLEEEKQWRPFSHKELTNLLLDKLAHTKEPEAQEEILRQFKLTQWMMAARAELRHFYDAVRIAQFLSDLAEVILFQVVEIAYNQLKIRYPEMDKIIKNFTLLAYGKFGTRELNYTSDLDLVFLHTATVEDEPSVNRLTQKILHMLTTRTQTGILYTVDTRLRPSGSAGLLVSHIDAFSAYQLTEAWTWEHQALIKARVVFGSLKIKQKFLALKKSVLVTVRDSLKLNDDVLSMRAKINQQQLSDPLKYKKGGLLDMEFAIQFLVLKLANPLLASQTHTLKLMNQLFLNQALNKKQYDILRKAYKQYHKILHNNVLLEKFSLPQERIFQAVEDVCKEVYKPS